ncbi:histone-lysine N-methyltransferase TRX1-like isoform X2 [Nymphaea colorata]|uniref:histone-lysine N-methyltransferase TRX1-like isoform X2 n=1 Tax=Nymphaea colorata TaxID=210225 RepID=UPI00129D9B9A|nr:histone-lysine N-methyltransferase TRX1-like isoform X2 [Nymphaea colorata]
MEEEEEAESGSPKRYVHIDRVYTNSLSCTVQAGPSKAMSRKIRARKFLERLESEPSSVPEPVPRPPIVHVYRRRKKRPRSSSGVCAKTSYADSAVCPTRDSVEGMDGLHSGDDHKKRGRVRGFKHELNNLGVDRKQFVDLGWSRKRERRERKARHGPNSFKSLWSGGSRYRIDVLKHSRTSSVKKWVQLSLENVDPTTLTGFKCKVFWPLDNDWYVGSITQYDPEKAEHHIRYEDGDDEWTSLYGQKIKFHLSKDEMRQKNLKCWDPERGLDYDDIIMLAASFYDNEELEHGDVIWAEIMGNAMWPALVTNEIHVDGYEGLQQHPREKLVPVRFFGTYDYARVNRKQVVTLLRGILFSFHLKCQDSRFIDGLEETWRYLREQKLPDKMMHLQCGNTIDDPDVGSVGDDTSNVEENHLSDEKNEHIEECSSPCPLEVGDLRVTRLGKIVKDSDHFHSERCIWPVGYSAVRKFTSVSDPNDVSEYKMEVLRNPKAKLLPLFRVTLDNGQQINGSSPSACWKKIYCLIRKAGRNLCNDHGLEGRTMRRRSGSYMFGFCNRKVRKLIQAMANSSPYSNPSKYGSQDHGDHQSGSQPVYINWKDLDRCNVCNMDEEYSSNLFLQCDKCRMMVHARCYGESEPWSGKLWLCNLCQPDAPSPPPKCCLCPVVGGALKITTDGRWAHLTCAMWIPETCLVDVKKMEPIDGLNMIHKDRWKLLCSICGVPYGACIQCSNSSCRVAYHPLCARAANLCVELEDEENILHLLFADEDDDHCIRLLSFCKKHRQPANKQVAADKQVYNALLPCPSYTPSTNFSGCARSEPYDFLGRRGRKEPDALAAASSKRSYVENRPYIVGGYRQNGAIEDASSYGVLAPTCHPTVSCQLERPRFLSLHEKYEYMKATFRKRLVFGKSAIHGFGVFAKHALRAGDMVIEYTGELVRPIIADIRESLIYNSLVGS